MSRKGENIYLRKDGRWEARIRTGRDNNGKITYTSIYGKTYNEVKEKIYTSSFKENKSNINQEATFSFSNQCDIWLSEKSLIIQPSTFVKYTTIIEKHIKPFWAKYSPEQINEFVYRDFANALFEKDLSVKSIKDILVVLYSIISFISSENEVVIKLPKQRFPKEAKKEMRVLTLEEQKILTKSLLSELDYGKLGLLFCLELGLRVGEICALKWKCISLEEKTVRIESTMQRLKNVENSSPEKTRIQIGLPKSESSIRTIPMTDQIYELCQSMHINDPEAYLLTGNKSFMEPRLLQYNLQNIAGQCGLENVHCHTLRHTFATRCVEVGFELKSLSEIMGHANTSITLNRYVHSSMNLKRLNMKKLNSVLKNKPSDI